MLARVLGQGRAPGVVVGIGDDAAVLAPGAEKLVWTTDAMVEGVHFERGWLTLRELGFRSVMVAASDLAAMGAAPRGVLSSLVLPPTFSDAELVQLARGQAAACARLGTAVCGGNLARGERLSLTISVLGAAARPLRRAGARPGDAVLLAGVVGLAGAGQQLLERGLARTAAARAAPRSALSAWRRPLARIAEGRRAAAVARAAIDISDGLAGDLGQMCAAAGAGLRIVLDAEALVSGELVAAAGVLGCAPLDLALFGGEDYALAVAAPAGAIPEGFRPIGRCERRRGGARLVLAESRRRRVIAAAGYDHFAP